MPKLRLTSLQSCFFFIQLDIFYCPNQPPVIILFGINICQLNFSASFNSLTFQLAQKLQQSEHQTRLNKARVLTAILALTNLLPAFYFCLIHQRGTIMVTKLLADAAKNSPEKTDILFLMPCHSTPYYRYVIQ